MASGNRARAVEIELCALGMTPEAAALLASDLVIRYPLARRGGVRALARQVEPRGLDPASAEAAAAMLLALELYDAGRSFGEVREALLGEGVGEPGALNAALDAARLHRTPREQPEGSDDLGRLLLCAAIAALGIVLLLI